MCGGDITGRDPPNLFPVCVWGGTQFAYCSRLGSKTPSHSREGFWGNRKRFGEWSLNTYALTQQLEAFKSPMVSQRSPTPAWFLPLPRELEYCLLENLVVRIGDPGKGLLLVWGAGEGFMGRKTCGARRGSGRGTNGEAFAEQGADREGTQAGSAWGRGRLSASTKPLGMQTRCKEARR